MLSPALLAVMGVLDTLGQLKVWSVKNCKDPNIRLTKLFFYPMFTAKNSVDHMFSTVVTEPFQTQESGLREWNEIIWSLKI